MNDKHTFTSRPVSGHSDSEFSTQMPRAMAPRPLAVALRRVLGGGLLAVGLAGPALGQSPGAVLSPTQVPNQSKSLDLSTLDGSNGFVFNSPAASVSGAGDVNGDGVDDLVLGNPSASPNGLGGAGQSYVVFGTNGGFPAALNPSDLNGDNGFTLNGIATDSYSGLADELGASVSAAGDMNGDGFDDVLVGAPGVHTFESGDVTGESYVVFGASGGFPPALERSDLYYSGQGFSIESAALDYSSASVSGAGDINGDGFDDVLIGVKHHDGSGGGGYKSYTGRTYVVFGGDGSYGSYGSYREILQEITGGYGGGITTSVSGAGDVNGDGLDDILISAIDDAGSRKVYVIFGSTNLPSNLSDLDGGNGFIINGIAAGGYYSGDPVSGAGDVNGDGFDDILIGAPFASPNGEHSGESYVVFGASGGFPAVLELSDLDGSNGFVLKGIAAGDLSGDSVSGAGDVNGDGLDDILIGAPFANPNGVEWAGQSYVVFGTSGGFPAKLDMSALDGSNGFIISGIADHDFVGDSVSGAGDVNGDGVDDFLIGAPGADQIYVVFGTSSAGGGPAVLLKALITDVKALDLPAGLEHWLARPLKRAEKKLDQGEVAKALYKVVGFIQRARVLRKYGILPADEANALIVQAKTLIKALLELPELSAVAASDLLPADLIPMDEPVPAGPPATPR